MAYATIADLESRWRTLTSDEQAVALTLLDDAAVLIDSMGTPSSTAAALIVSCDMVRRSMSMSQADAYGLSQASMTAGPYAQQWTYANPTGELYVTRTERKMLGFLGGSIGFARPAYGRLEPEVDADDQG